jgi:hypothetical protein
MFGKVNDIYWYYIKGLRRYEVYLNKYQGYGSRNILEFKRRNNLEWRTIDKILSNLKIIDGLEVRNHIRHIYEANQELFDNPKTYICQFGPLGKSSGIILNQFLRCYPSKYYKLKPITEIQELTEDYNIIFLDDFIGSGQQAIDYIKVISRSLNPSVKAYLFTIAATENGLKKVKLYNSKFSIYTSILLDNKNFFLLHEESNILNSVEKKTLKDVNRRLGFRENNEYQLGIPFSFFYSTPDNSMGLLWADKLKYNDSKNIQREWYGLTPREY